MSLLFQIGLGVGLGVAAGLRPFLPTLLACGLAVGHHFKMAFRYGHFHFLQKDWWLLAVAGLYILVWVVQVLLKADPFNPFGRRPLAIVIALMGAAAAALLFGGTLRDHGHHGWIGAVAGAGCAALATVATAPILSGARKRLTDRAAREALSLYVDGVALVFAAMTVAYKPLGFLTVPPMLLLLAARLRRRGTKYAGLRILR
ncbi:MAG TPA: DUF4126 family protein [Solirubrobacteraceae bacterium]|nr:DUF4126 family protein [Solirubrobacteraceae bacterium]